MSHSGNMKANANSIMELNSRITIADWKWKFQTPKKPNYDTIHYYKRTKEKKIMPVDSNRADFCREQRNLISTENRLKSAKINEEKQRKRLNKQWKELKIRENELRENFKKFNEFLRRNYEKRHRSEQRTEKTRALIVERTEAIEKIKIEIEMVKKTLAMMRTNDGTMEIYEKFLNRVVATGYFKNNQDVINRYLTLDETKKKIALEMRKSSERFGLNRDRYEERLASFKIAYLKLSNKLSDLRERYDNLRMTTNEREVLIQNIANKFVGLAKELTWSKMALQQMFEITQFRRTKASTDKKKKDFEKILQISNTLKGLENIEGRLRKIYGHSDISTSLEAIMEEKKEELDKPTDFSQMKLFADKDMGSFDATSKYNKIKTVSVERKPFVVFDGKLPVKTPKLTFVKDFEERYRNATRAIEEEKAKKLRLVTYSYGVESKPSKEAVETSKWNLAKVMQKMMKGNNLSPEISSTPQGEMKTSQENLLDKNINKWKVAKLMQKMTKGNLSPEISSMPQGEKETSQENLVEENQKINKWKIAKLMQKLSSMPHQGETETSQEKNMNVNKWKVANLMQKMTKGNLSPETPSSGMPQVEMETIQENLLDENKYVNKWKVANIMQKTTKANLSPEKSSTPQVELETIQENLLDENKYVSKWKVANIMQKTTKGYLSPETPPGEIETSQENLVEENKKINKWKIAKIMQKLTKGNLSPEISSILLDEMETTSQESLLEMFSEYHLEELLDTEESEEDLQKTDKKDVILPKISSESFETIQKKKFSHRELERQFRAIEGNPSFRQAFEKQKLSLPPISPTST